ncbi:MAG: hypothetical protein JOY90_17660 [Bradyrhizobium sp.]|uniref:hypothetical protein n=1 Tax=Bradyrhizobium sp. TaxID=376 RepID=UPI001DF675B0|nr:hypothetical protein [Bradyrhizobium sp.]MBV9562249.1 hypothetical protein [Bradyrhizobium sp.]
MKSIPLAALVLLVAGGAGHAQSAGEAVKGLDACVEAARLAEESCSKTTDPTQRLICVKKASSEQLDCLERALTAAPAGPAAENGAAPGPAATTAAISPAGKDSPVKNNTANATPPNDNPAPAISATASDAPAPAQQETTKAEAVAKQDATPVSSTASVEPPATSSPADKAPAPDTPTVAVAQPTVAVAAPQPAPAAAPPPQPVAAPQPAAATLQADPPVSDERPMIAAAPESAEQAAKVTAADEAPKTDAPKTEATKTEAPKTETTKTESARTEPSKTDAPKIDAPKTEVSKTEPAKTVVAAPAKPAEQAWVVSEISSPIDYSPLLTATIRPTPAAPDGPGSLTIRCHGGHTALSVRASGAWTAPRDGLAVSTQVDDQPVMAQKWKLSADARTATSTDLAGDFLKSLPDGGQLKISVTDRDGGHHDATFVLSGLDAVRTRLDKACGEQAMAKASTENDAKDSHRSHRGRYYAYRHHGRR